MDSYEDCSLFFFFFLGKKKKKKQEKNLPHISFQEKKFQASNAGLIEMGKMEVGISKDRGR